ncbi:hypothetical protein N9N67_05105 [Bacteriovoracaceae bacterium]|nr:hypothetical protein [Bacteriovoracaceae bacterium]
MKKKLATILFLAMTHSMANSLGVITSYCNLEVVSEYKNENSKKIQLISKGVLFCSDKTGTERFHNEKSIDLTEKSIAELIQLGMPAEVVAKSQRLKYLNEIIDSSNEEDSTLSYRVTNCTDNEEKLSCWLEKKYISQ